jgi:hypothetical protein
VIELAEIFRQYGPAYRAKFSERLLPSHRQAMWAIEHCRTAALGGQVYHCPDCDHDVYQYHSCRNRHCPKCQNEQAQRWLEQQWAMLLPVPYFMLTFTLPAALRPIARQHQTLIYDRLFRSSAAATQHLADDPRFIGGELGLVGVLHTWGRTLTYHPHVHYLIPAGGWLAETRTWQPARDDFLVPVKALSGIFRARVRDALRPTEVFDQIPAKVWTTDWVVHCQTVGNGETAFKYLAPYVFRVALSNRRLVKVEDERVTFRYRATDTGQPKLCTLAVEEFIHRFLQHVLPRGFVKVRYYGFVSAGQRSQLALIRQHLGAEPRAEVKPVEPPAADLTPPPVEARPVDDQPVATCSDVVPVAAPPPEDPPAEAAAANPNAPVGTPLALPDIGLRCPHCGRLMARRPLPRPDPSRLPGGCGPPAMHHPVADQP